MNFIPCIAWVKKGVAKAVPDKVQLTKEELQQLIHEAREDLKNINGDDDSKETENIVEEVNEEEDFNSRYDLDNYDDDDANPVDNLAGLTEFASNDEDPALVVKDQDDVSDDEEDFRIHETDNLIAVGHVEDEFSTLEVHVYNEDNEQLYIHHDIVLPAYPLALEWCDYHPADQSPGNFLAISDMTPVIQIWDLDLVDTLEPVAVLGQKPKKKEKHGNKSVCHSDAVLSLSWNKLVRHGLASGSADCKAIVWDLSKVKAILLLDQHKDKVQTVMWHPCEAEMLLTGSCDKNVMLHDCRSSENRKTWTTDGEVENVVWNHFDPYCFFAGTDKGVVHGFDVRSDKSVFTLKAHSQSVTGMALSSFCPGCLVTVSDDKTVKVWDVAENRPSLVVEKNPRLGSLFTLSASPDSAFVFAVGGDNKLDNFKVWDIRNSKAVRQRFQERIPASFKVEAPESDGDSDDNDAAMDTDITMSGLQALSLAEGSSKSHKKLQKRKTFSKKKTRKM